MSTPGVDPEFLEEHERPLRKLLYATLGPLLNVRARGKGKRKVVSIAPWKRPTMSVVAPRLLAAARRARWVKKKTRTKELADSPSRPWLKSLGAKRHDRLSCRRQRRKQPTATATIVSFTNQPIA
jgi:hypothetical protein